MAEIDRFFDVMLKQGGSDLLLAEGQPPKLRLHGRVTKLEDKVLTREFIESTLKEICSPDRWKRYEQTGDLDFAYALGDRARFRANYYKHTFGRGGIFRVIPSKILTLDDLKCPQAIREFAKLRYGLVLVTGPTGSGKSTTLAAVIDAINGSECRHILTVEEPIEFVHPVKKSVIVQREVGVDVPSFGDALRAAARLDCDVILVGEMRDYETISLALSAAEKGLLVFGTLHTNSAPKTIDRLIDAFPNSQQDAVRKSLAVVLKGVCSQLLCKRGDGKGRVAVHEILVQTPALSNIIREGGTAKIVSVLQSGKASGMQLMDNCIDENLKAGNITGQEAYMKALEKQRFAQYAPTGDGAGGGGGGH